MSLTLLAPTPAPSTAVPGPDEPWAGLLEEIARDTRVGVDGFRLDGDVVRVSAQRGHGHRQVLVASLTHALYQRYYHHHATPHHHRGTAETVDKRPASARGDAAFCRRLTDALGERWYWEGGWRVLGRARSGDVVVERDDLVLHVTDDAVRVHGADVRVRFPADRPWASTGYHVVTGTSGPITRAQGLARVYLHLLPSTAPEVFARLVAGLDALGMAFTAKVLNDPLAFGRPDSAVVYVAREHVAAVVRVATAERCRAASSFGRSVPAFTREVLPGVAVADDPGPTVSFGQHRCCTIANGLVTAGPDALPAARLRAVRDALAADGLDPAALHLNPGHAEFDLGGVA
jgi:hypothetical protein